MASRSSLVSILMPVKDTALFLCECIESIIAQTEQNWELIAVDDHSTDQSWDIINRIAQEDQRVKIYKNQGVGIIPALRTAYAVSKGDLITRMDSDDVMMPRKLQALKVNLLSKGRGHVAVGLVKYFSQEQLGEGFRKYERWLNRLSRSGKNYTEIYKECVIPSPCWMAFRSDLERCGAFEHNVYPEDYDLCLRFYENGLKVIPAHDVFHLWRDHPDRVSRNDEHYSDNSFIDLKIDYFLKLHYRPDVKLYLWGAGKKGKKVARNLIDQNIPFTWLCNNRKKIGTKIYDTLLHDPDVLDSKTESQLIVCVANPIENQSIRKSISIDYLKCRAFFFC